MAPKSEILSNNSEPATTKEEREEAGKMRSGGVEMENDKMEVKKLESKILSVEEAKEVLIKSMKSPLCEIDPDCRQKYALIQVFAPSFPEAIYIVRGKGNAAYHKDAASPALRALSKSGIPGLGYEVLGGGRITHSTSKKQILVYGHSYGFPWEEGIYRHEITATVIQSHFPNFDVAHDNTEGLY